MPAPPTAVPGKPARILVVCTGNICRSPAVERLLRAGLDPRPGNGPDGALGTAGAVAVRSAGTRAVVGAAMSVPMATLVRAAGADPDGFAARQLTPALVGEADLVLAMTREHRAAVVGLVPAAVRRTFTLRELARLIRPEEPAGGGPASTTGLTGSAAERLRALPTLAARRRGAVPAPPGDDDVLDPFGRDEATYRQAFALLAPAVTTLLRALGR
ncbi:arsenate reductase/protein-tyrosine-phosphatase family protein [Cellulomonas hominis]